MKIGSYSKYISWYRKFSSSKKGYYEACDFLAFDNDPWVEFDDYKNEIKKELVGLGGGSLINGADMCCGEYMWLYRHFSEYFSKLYLVDMNKNSFEAIGDIKAGNQGVKIKTIVGDASKVVLPEKVDFIYCGFNVYPKFMNNFINSLNKNGVIFLMKPKMGDDLNIRSMVTGYSLFNRLKEIDEITALLSKNCFVDYFETKYNWVFTMLDIDKVLAGLSIVSMGKDFICFDKNQYVDSKAYLLNRLCDKKIVITQKVSMWRAIKKL